MYFSNVLQQINTIVLITESLIRKCVIRHSDNSKVLNEKALHTYDFKIDVTFKEIFNLYSIVQIYISLILIILLKYF